MTARGRDRQAVAGTRKVAPGEGNLLRQPPSGRGSQAAEYSLMRPPMSWRRRMAVIVGGQYGGGAARRSGGRSGRLRCGRSPLSWAT
jgi:hypothetical protein